MFDPKSDHMPKVDLHKFEFDKVDIGREHLLSIIESFNGAILESNSGLIIQLNQEFHENVNRFKSKNAMPMIQDIIDAILNEYLPQILNEFFPLWDSQNYNDLPGVLTKYNYYLDLVLPYSESIPGIDQLLTIINAFIDSEFGIDLACCVLTIIITFTCHNSIKLINQEGFLEKIIEMFKNESNDERIRILCINIIRNFYIDYPEYHCYFNDAILPLKELNNIFYQFQRPEGKEFILEFIFYYLKENLSIEFANDVCCIAIQLIPNFTDYAKERVLMEKCFHLLDHIMNFANYSYEIFAVNQVYTKCTMVKFYDPKIISYVLSILENGIKNKCIEYGTFNLSAIKLALNFDEEESKYYALHLLSTLVITEDPGTADISKMLSCDIDYWFSILLPIFINGGQKQKNLSLIIIASIISSAPNETIFSLMNQEFVSSIFSYFTDGDLDSNLICTVSACGIISRICVAAENSGDFSFQRGFIESGAFDAINDLLLNNEEIKSNTKYEPYFTSFCNFFQRYIEDQ